MPTCSEVIQSAYRRSGIMAAGVNMNASQSQVGLELFIGMLQNLIVGGMFGRATDEVYDSATTYEAKEGYRIYNRQSATITLPELVRDELYGDMRQPRDGAFITIVDPDITVKTKQYLYDRATAGWVAIHSLVLASEAPLCGRFEDHIKNMLAVRLLGESGQPTPLELIRAEGRARLALSFRRDGERTTGTGCFS
jgi:hypothetical protein